MCGMNCGTVSSIAWPLLKRGVDASVTVSDADAELSRCKLSDHGFQVGPCSAATFAAITKICKCPVAKDALDLNKGSTIVLLATEGPR